MVGALYLTQPVDVRTRLSAGVLGALLWDSSFIRGCGWPELSGGGEGMMIDFYWHIN